MLGNPPYVDSENLKKNTPEFREFLTANYDSTKGNWDLFIVFHEVAIKLLKSNRIKSFITPNKWISIKYAEELRKLYKKHLFKLCICDDIQVFEAGVSPIISFFKKTDSPIIKIDRVDPSYNFSHVNTILQDTVSEDELGILLSPHVSTILKIRNSEKRFSDYLICENPFTTGEAYILSDMVVEEDSLTTSDKYYKIITTGTIDPFINLWGIKTTSYLKGKYKHPVVSESNLVKTLPKRLLQIQSPKLAITGMRYLECYYDKSGNYISSKSTLIIRDIKDNNYLLFCGLLNSKLISFYIKQCYSTMGIDGGINFNKQMIETLPIPLLDKKTSEAINKIVIECISANEKNEDSEELMNLLDETIYKLYDLSPQEIEVISC